MPGNRLKDEDKLLQKLSEGNELAFTLIFDHYRPFIYIAALKILKDQHLSEEVVQDVFLAIWKHRQRMNGIQNLKGYLFMMARNNIYDRFKKLASEKTVYYNAMKGKKNTVDNTDHRIIEEQYFSLLKQTLALLPPRQQQIYYLSRDQGMSYKQIGKKLDISPLTVKKHMSEALKFIRKQLESHIRSLVFLPVLLEIFCK